MVLVVLGILAVAAGAAWWWLRRNASEAGVSTPTGIPAASHAKPGVPKPKTWGKQLVIPTGSMPCENAIELAGKCFPGDKAPSLPLAGCTVATCSCRYEPLPERRVGGERRNTIERRGEIRFDPDKPDRRSGKDRRKDAYHWESGV